MAEPDSGQIVRLTLDGPEHVAWLGLRQALWMGSDVTTEAARNGTLLTDPERFGALAYEVFLAVDEDNSAAGFIEVSLRDDLDVFGRRQVGYVEGIYVEPRYRGTGLGRALIETAAEWTRRKAVQELVADVLGENTEGLIFHERSGFNRVGERSAGGKRQVLYAMMVA
jgi:aminoglycoside 6'-N-acetyltransferase I